MRITFKQFLADSIIKSATYTTLEVQHAVEFLNKNARSGLKSISNGSIMWRGFGYNHIASDEMWTKVDTSTLHRTSRDTNNVYQLLMDNSDLLRDYPSRTKSLFCTTSLHHARDYTTGGKMPYAVIPVDGTKIAVSHYSDFIMTQFDNMLQFRNVNSMSTYMGVMLQYIGVDKNADYEWADFDKIANKLNSTPSAILALCMSKERGYHVVANTDAAHHVWDKMYNSNSLAKLSQDDVNALVGFVNTGDIELDETMQKFYVFLEKAGEDKAQALANYFGDPSRLKLSLASAGDALPTDKGLGREVWFEGTAIIIPLTAFRQILLQLEDLDYPIDNDLYRQVMSK